MENHDRSHRDKMYFIDDTIYNCPFCKRKHVKYKISDKGSYDADNTKKMYFFIVKCEDCEKESFHLTSFNLAPRSSRHARYPNSIAFPPMVEDDAGNRNTIANNGKEITELDECFLFHQPSASFTIDLRIDRQIRDQLTQSINCLNSNFLTGATACLRKAMYRLLKNEAIPDKNDNNQFLSHDDRIDLLKKKHSQLDQFLLDDLKGIHSLTSQELHENDWEDFNSSDLQFLYAIFQEVLYEMYIAPIEKESKKRKLDELKKSASKKGKRKE